MAAAKFLTGHRVQEHLVVIELKTFSGRWIDPGFDKERKRRAGFRRGRKIIDLGTRIPGLDQLRKLGRRLGGTLRLRLGEMAVEPFVECVIPGNHRTCNT